MENWDSNAMKVCCSVAIGCAALCITASETHAQSAPTASAPSAIPPIVLQGCAEKVKAKHASLFASATGLAAKSKGDQVVGFDVSFVNTTSKVAKIVMIRIGETEFTKIGKFSPDAVIAWRIAAKPGACSVRAVRFEDGSEWAPSEENTTPLPAATSTPQ
jgi:hypothetical protein